MSGQTMRAVVLHAARDVRVEERPIPVPAADEVLLRVTAAGICGSDAFFYEMGPGSQDDSAITEPIVLGHEFAGEVAEVGSAVTGLAPGDLVSSGAGVSCGTCAPCRKGKTNLCLRYSTAGIHQDGGLAEFCAVAAATCELAARHGVTGDDAALAQPMAIAHHSVHRGRIRSGERALIFGVGGIGMFATWVASQAGAEVTAVDLSAERLELAARVGAAHTHVLGDGARPAELMEAEPFDVIYEITGAAEPLKAAMALARRGTRVVMVGVQKSNYDLDARRMVVEELELITSAAHVRGVDLPAALALVGARKDGWADVAPKVLPLERVLPDGIIPLSEKRAPHIKTLIDPAVAQTRAYSR
jgi:(R,R)-butanediol dehydrogenase/meso-butanediol dehydrogenase/diacetyl reductase